MSVRPDPVIPETRRRRASTTEKSERILKMSRSLTLTRSVLAGTLAEATPNQLDFIERWFTAELDSRERSKRLRLLKQAGFPADKTLDGYDWTNLKMPADWGRAQLENLDFVAGCEDLVLYGPVGTGKSHLAIAIGRLACERGVPVRFFTATGLLMRLRRAQQENRLDRELASIGKARLLIIDEFGYLPIDEEGSRLLFQIISDSYETRSIIYTTNIEFSGWGRVLGDKNMAAALIDRTVHHGRLIRFEGRSYRSEHALMTKQPTQRRQAAADTAHPAENPLPTLRKNTAHKADANLLKHNSEMIMRTHAPRGFAAALAGFEKNLAAQDIWIEPARDGERSVVGRDDRLFEACKRNPILTHRHLGAGEPVQCVGHADLLLHPTVGWLLACLGIRETPGEEPGETFSYCGRETFVAPVVWQHNPVSWKLDGGEPNKRIDIVDPGWPVVAPGLGRLPEKLVVDVDEDGLPCAVRGVDSAGCDCAAGNNAACPAELIQLDDTRLVGVRGRDDYRFLRVDGQEYAAFTRPEYTMMMHQDSTHAVMVMAEAESGQLTAEITDRGDKRCIALGALGANEWFGLRLHGNRLEFLAGQPAPDSIDEGTMPDIALIAHADVTYARIMADCDARFLSTEWAGGFVGCLIGVKRR